MNLSMILLNLYITYKILYVFINTISQKFIIAFPVVSAVYLYK